MADYTPQQRLIAALRNPHRYPHGAKTVTLIETHISWVLLAGRYAYKIKKAVNLGFLDFSTLKARQFFCHEEVRLNRRLAPKLYLGVIPVMGDPSDPRLGENGDRRATGVIEYAVKMRRFASTGLMDRLLAQGKITPQHIDRLAETVAHFHRSLPAAEQGSSFGTCASILAAAMGNFSHLGSLQQYPSDQAMISALREQTQREYAERERHFEHRRAQGMVRECHGDLHLGNIAVIGDEPVPFDCIEFQPELRWIDVMSEVAFTLMDLLHHGRTDLAFRFLNAYLEITGDYAGVTGLRFYVMYRATVRGMVCVVRASQAGLSDAAKTKELAASRAYLALAAQSVPRGRAALIITHGLPGSGKSTFAQIALERLGAIRIRSDIERKRLFGLHALDDSRAFGADIYTPAATRATYARLGELAQDLLAAGYPVIVDAAFLRQDERRQFLALATDMNVPFVIASVSTSEAVLRPRLARRQSLKQDASEANEAVLHVLNASQEPLTPKERVHTVTFVNDQPEQLMQAAAWEHLSRVAAGDTI
jgi:aminoglycoside phosphotransferase family enzyme/predicted kinase